MPSTYATISIPHESGERIAATFDCTFTPEEIYNYSLSQCDPQEIDGVHDLDAWIDMMMRNSPRLLDDLLHECREKLANGEADA